MSGAVVYLAVVLPCLVLAQLPGSTHHLPTDTVAGRPHFPDPTASARRHRRAAPSPVAIMFAVIGGLVVVGMLCALARFLYVHKKVPKRDRIAEIIDRHQLHEEIASQRNSFFLPLPGTPRRFEPAPAYFPPPPSYDIAGSVPARGEGYIGLSSGSPRHTPTNSLSEAIVVPPNRHSELSNGLPALNL